MDGIGFREYRGGEGPVRGWLDESSGEEPPALASCLAADEEGKMMVYMGEGGEGEGKMMVEMEKGGEEGGGG